MSDTLKYALELNAKPFEAGAKQAMGAIGGIGGKLAAILGVGGGLAGIGAGVFGQIFKGAELSRLGKATGETVGNLVKMEAGFKAVLHSADSLPNFLGQMQRALGGVTEMGEPTAFVFSQMGLSIDELKRSGGPEAMQKILGSLRGMDQSSAMFAAGKIFGRANAQDAIILARSTNDFAKAMEYASGKAAMMERNAEAFHKIEMTLGRLQGKGAGLFLGIAEGAAPGIQMAMDKLNTIDLSGFGKRIGDAVALSVSALKDDNFGKMLLLIFAGSIMEGINFVIASAIGLYEGLKEMWGNGDIFHGFAAAGISVFQLLSEVLFKFLSGPINYLEASLLNLENKLRGTPSTFKGMLKIVEERADKASEERMDSAKRNGMEALSKLNPINQGNNFANGFTNGFNKALLGLSNGYFDELDEMSKKLKGKKQEIKEEKGNGNVTLIPVAGGKAGKGIELTEWARMGFGTGWNPGNDYARKTAENTEKQIYWGVQVFNLWKSFLAGWGKNK